MMFLLLLFVAVLSTNTLKSQDWYTIKEVSGAKLNFFDLQKEFYKSHNESDIHQKGSGIKQFKRWEYFWQNRVLPNGDFPPLDITQKALNDWLIINKKTDNVVQSASWQSMGPSTTSGGYNGLGRLNCIMLDPQNSNRIWVGAASGGLWRSTDGGQSWTTNTDKLSIMQSLGVSSIAIHPTNSNIMYIATGDINGQVTYSLGVLKSTDAGQTWAQTGLDWQRTNFRRISKIIINPDNPNTILASSTNGIYRSTNAGSTWEQTATQLYYDIEFKPGDPEVVYASGRTAIKSTDGGVNWNTINTGLPSSNVVTRMEIAVTPANPSFVYLLAANSSGGSFRGLYLTTDEGTNWQTQSTTPNILGYYSDGSDNAGQGWYDLTVVSSPTDSNVVFSGGVNIFKSTDKGVTWSAVAMWTSHSQYNKSNIQEVHADHHDLIYFGSRLYNANDGGIYYSTNDGSSWVHTSNGLVITQNYKLSVSQNSVDRVFTGTQDNGSKLLRNGNWSNHIGGDGMECIIDPINEAIMYGSLYYGEVSRTTNTGQNWSKLTHKYNNQTQKWENKTGESGAWVTPYLLNPLNNRSFFIGYKNLWKNTNSGLDDTYTKLTNFSDNHNISSIDISPLDSNHIVFVKNNTIYRTTNGGTNWTTLSIPSSDNITDVKFSAANVNKFFYVVSNYSTSNKVYVTTNGGTNWTNLTGSNLPAVPINCIVEQSANDERIIIGTDLGVFSRTSSNSVWTSLNEGLPFVIVRDMEFHKGSGRLYAGTYGRGLWYIDLFVSVEPPTLATPNNNSKGVNYKNLNFTWNRTQGNTTRIQISTNENFSSTVFDTTGIVGTSLSFNNRLQPNTQYYWRAMAQSGISESSWSSVFNFKTRIGDPTLISPKNDSLNLGTTLNLQWSVVAGAEKYELQVSENQNFSNFVFNNNDLSGNNLDLQDLEFSKVYYWRVKAKQADGDSDWSNIFSFSTQLSTPVLTAPTDNQFNVNLSGVVLSWNIVQGADLYKLIVSKNQNFSEPFVNTDIDTNRYLFSNLSPNTKYWWSVSAKSNSGLTSDNAVFSFTSTIVSPSLKDLTAKTFSLDTNHKFEWNVVSGANSYNIQISDNITFSELIIDSEINQAEYKSSLNLGSIYYVRVSAKNANSQSAWSESYEVMTKYAAPIVNYPTTSDKFLPLNTEFDITLAHFPSMVSLEVSDMQDFSSGVINNNFQATSANSKRALNLNRNNARFFYRAGYTHQQNASYQGAIGDFTTLLATPNHVVPNNNVNLARTDITFRWEIVAGADNYKVVYSNDPENKTGVTELTSSALTQDIEVELNSQYYWQVQAMNSDGNYSELSEIFAFTTNDTEMVELVTPPHNSNSHGTQLNLSWNYHRDDVEFDFELATDQNFNSKVLEQSGINVKNLQVDNLEFAKRYFWRVRSDRQGLKSPWSNVSSFYTRLAKPNMLENNIMFLVSQPWVLNWETVSEASSYIVKLSTFESLAESESFDVQSNSIDFSDDLELNTEYYWTVNAISSVFGNSEDNLTFKFTTPNPSSILFKGNEKFLVFPNPATNMITISINNFDFLDTDIEIYTIDGKLMKEEEITNAISEINIEELASGSYSLHLLKKGILISTQNFVVKR